MKILEINKFYYRRRGAESHFLDLLDLLREGGDEVAVFSMQHKENLSSPWGKYFVQHVGYNNYDSTAWERFLGVCRIFWSLEARRNLQTLLQKFHPDIVHIHNIYHQLSPSILGVCKKQGVPIVMTVHDHAIISPDKDVYYPEIARHYWKFLFVQKYGFLKRVLLVLKMYVELWWKPYDAVDQFIAPSEFVRKNLLSWGIPSEKISVLPLFLTVQGIKNIHNNISQRYDLPAQFALYVGSVSQEKGIDHLVEMFKELRSPLVLVGSVEEGIQQKGNKFIYFLGQQKKEDVESLLERCSFVVSGSQLSETFGLVILEANGYGKPFIGFSIGAFPEIVKEGENGYLVSSWEEMKKIIHKIISGQISFNADTIRGDAWRKYDKEKYSKEVHRLFQYVMRK